MSSPSSPGGGLTSSRHMPRLISHVKGRSRPVPLWPRSNRAALSARVWVDPQVITAVHDSSKPVDSRMTMVEGYFRKLMQDWCASLGMSPKERTRFLKKDSYKPISKECHTVQAGLNLLLETCLTPSGNRFTMMSLISSSVLRQRLAKICFPCVHKKNHANSISNLDSVLQCNWVSQEHHSS